MSSYRPEQYKAYKAASSTVAKTKQIVMLYDGVITCMKRAGTAIQETRIEDRFNQLSKASEILMALQSSIDFDNGGDIAQILHDFYTQASRRVISINFIKEKEKALELCAGLIEEIKQMRSVWDEIDRAMSLSHGHQHNAAIASTPVAQPGKPTDNEGGNVIISA